MVSFLTSDHLLVFATMGNLLAKAQTVKRVTKNKFRLIDDKMLN